MLSSPREKQNSNNNIDDNKYNNMNVCNGAEKFHGNDIYLL